MKNFIKYIFLILFITACNNSSNKTEDIMENKTKHQSKSWGYTGKISDKYWSKLDKKYYLCSEGKLQSPINIIGTRKSNLAPLLLDYKRKAKSIINNSHTIQVNISEGSTFTIDKDKYELKQFHFHSPSENHIEGKSFPFEAHFVHANKDGKLAVIAVMFEYAKKNSTISKIWRNFPLKVGENTKLSLNFVDINKLMPSNKSDYYKFEGSLTTPPCSEGVKWYVYKTPLNISKKQVKKFFDIYGHSNNRSIQDTNKREIQN